MPRLPEAEVTILVDGVPLPEHNIEFIVQSDKSQRRLVRTSVVSHFPPLNFHFHYANKDLLTARDIIPSVRPKMEAQQEPTPVPRRKKRVRDSKMAGPEDDDITAEEKKELERLQAKMARSQAKRVKKEVKTEPELSNYKMLVDGVIDLTDD